MEAGAVRAVVEHVVLWGCAGALAAVAGGLLAVCLAWARVRRLGWPTYAVLGLMAVGAAVAGTPTRAGKARGRALRHGAPREDVPSVRPLSAADYRAGFALARIGTGESFDFSPPAGAAVCEDWRRFGAAEDWFKIDFTNGWTFAFGTNRIGALTVFSSGSLRPRLKDAGTCLAPLAAPLGLVPAADARPSRFWSHFTPSNTFLATWQNVLLDRRADAPVSFQAELSPDGCAVFRYDLSRLSGAVVSNLAVGLLNGGAGRTFSALARTTTSLRWARLDSARARALDPDGDGLSTEDEIFVHGTDPYVADTDFDGLSDGEEVNVTHTDPLNPHSLSDAWCDGVAVKIGDADPFSCPPGSTNTVWEHLFYTGTTNAAFAFPEPSETEAVLRVAVSGAGAGELVVGDRIVPLLGVRPSRSASPPAPTLHVPVEKGADVRLLLRGGAGLSVALGADDFAFGRLPSGAAGFVNFPYTRATPPCIHDFYARRRRLSLPVGGGAEALTCTWRGSGRAEVKNEPPRAALVTAHFSARGSSGISYTLAHPLYLFGRTVYDQIVRFCPKPSDDPSPPPLPDPPVPDPPPQPDPPWFDETGEGEDAQEVPSVSCCLDGGGCWEGGACGCAGCGCPCGFADDDDEEDDDGGGDALCRVHRVAYDVCAPLHEAAYTNAVRTVAPLRDVLHIRDPPSWRLLSLDVPSAHHACCPCPEHATNAVSLAFLNPRLRLVDAEGRAFRHTTTSCVVRLAGAGPSTRVGDAEVAFARNGEIYQRRACTVLGVGIRAERGPALAVYNGLSAALGYPFVVNTNVWRAPALELVTKVGFRGGNVRVELADATGAFALWYYDLSRRTYRKLLDSSTGGVRDMPYAHWRRMFGGGAVAQVRLTSSAPGRARLVFRYWNVVDGAFLQDEAVQRLSSIPPPLLPDYDRDGAVDERDAAAEQAGRKMCFWTNRDVWSGDTAFEDAYLDCARGRAYATNGDDARVNGRNDLVNLLPLAVRVAPLLDAWGARATVRLRATLRTANVVRRCYSNVPHGEARRLLESDTVTAGEKPEPLHTARLAWLTPEGDTLAEAGVDGRTAGFVLLEAVGGWVSSPVALVVEADGREVFSYSPEIDFCDVDAYYRWLNVRDAAGGAVADEEFYQPGGPGMRPDDQTDGTHVVFVHGYNVNEREARLWGCAVFKRLWWAGMESGFSVVAWRGDAGQRSYPVAGLVTPDYQANVENAFASAARLSAAVNALPGRRYMVAHSLGNMLVSAAAQDHALAYEKYFLLNAAVPVEAYDASAVSAETRARMTPEAWAGYPVRVRAAGWHALFGAGDARRTLTWKGRFADVARTVNYYSSEEEVLKCGHGEDQFTYKRSYAWYNQERYKGVKDLLQSAMGFGRNEGGWGFNDAYKKTEIEYDATTHGIITRLRPRTPEEVEAEGYSDGRLKAVPFFGPFAEGAICSSNEVPEISAGLRAQLLADAIPAESLAAGYTAVPAWKGLNWNMSKQFKNDAMTGKPSNHEWVHSFFIQAPYSIVYKLFKDIVRQVKEGQ